jgi:transposase
MGTSSKLQRENERLRAQLEQKDAALEQKDAALEQKDAALEQKDAMLGQRDRALAEQAAALAEIQRENETLQLELKKLLERMFGSRSERYIDDPRQLKLDLGGGDDPQIDDAVEGLEQAVLEAGLDKPPRKRRKRKKPDEKFPPHIPRQVVDVDLSDEEKQGLKHIGYDTTETLQISRPKLTVVETRYHKYVAAGDPEAGVKSPPRAVGLVEGNKYDTSIAAEIIANRLGYHLPFYRQQDQFAGSGWTPSRSTLLNIQTAAAELIRPLVRHFADCVRGDPVVGTDDTGVKLLLPRAIPPPLPDDPKSQRVHEILSEALEQGRTHVNAKMWAYRGATVPLNVFDFTVSRHRDGPDLFLIDNGFAGTLLGDCYGANTGIAVRSSGSIVHAACVSHARRHVRDALGNHQAHAETLLAMFQELYDVEARGSVLDAGARLALRRSEASAVWERMRGYIDTRMTDLLPKDLMSQAVGYLRNQWAALTRYLDDPLIPIDNNETEQLMKQIALGRKNWIFIGSVRAGYRTADLMTLVSSAIRNDLDVWSYLKGVLDALLGGETDYDLLLPHNWAAAHPDQIRDYRREERGDRAARKSETRARRRAAAAAKLR